MADGILSDPIEPFSFDMARVAFLHVLADWLRSPDISPAIKAQEIAATVSAVTQLGRLLGK
jgi:hypothetical protein